MAEKQQQNVRPLRPLLNSVYEVHRKDIKAYTSGHLNPGKLLKREKERHMTWESSKWEPSRLGVLNNLYISYCDHEQGRGLQ